MFKKSGKGILKLYFKFVVFIVFLISFIIFISNKDSIMNSIALNDSSYLYIVTLLLIIIISNIVSIIYNLKKIDNYR